MYTVSSYNDAVALLAHFGIQKSVDNSQSFVKYPRTRHLLDLGTASRDDLVLPDTELHAYLNSSLVLTIEEKVDGAVRSILITEYRLEKDSKGRDNCSKQIKQY